MLYQLSSFDSPESLYEQCLHFLVDNWRKCLTEKKSSTSFPKNGEHINEAVLPNHICEAFFELYLRKNKVLKCDFLNVFKNPKFTRLKKVIIPKYYYYTFSTKDFITILHPDIRDLQMQNNYLINDISELAELLEYLNKNGSNLKTFSCNKKFFLPAFKVKKNKNIHVGVIKYAFEKWDHVLNILSLEKLTLNDFNCSPPGFFSKMITPLKKLTHLDITDCSSMIDYSFLSELPQLKSLTLHNVMVTEEGFKVIKKLRELEHLDLSASINTIYEKPEMIYFALEGLPSLVSLDISKTNLDIDIGEALKMRKNELLYLGLYKTYNNVCRENNIYARRIAGDANIKQLFNAGYAHFERETLMRRLLIDFTSGLNNFIEYDLILNFALKILDRHPILAGDCQALFKQYLDLRIPLTPKVRNHLIRTTMNMAIIDDAEIDIEYFSKWTTDQLFCNEKLVMSFIKYLIGKKMEKEWAQVILYHMLNIISESQRELFAKYGIIKALTTAIANIEVPFYFEWDFTWRCVRNNFVNSKAFLENHGLDLFTKEFDYLTEHSPESNEIMERELVVYFSLAQFESLAKEHLMQGSLIWILSELLERDLPQSPYRPNNGPRVNYYAGCILLKLLSYESSQAAIDQPKREEILKNILVNLEKWSPDLIPHCYIEEELFEIIVNLLRVQNIPECRYWAVWGIFHFRYDVQQKYFSSDREEGLSLLKEIVETKSVPRSVKEISKKLLKKWSSDS